MTLFVTVNVLEDYHYDQLQKVMGSVFKRWPTLSYGQKQAHNYAFSRLLVALFVKGTALDTFLNRFGGLIFSALSES